MNQPDHLCNLCGHSCYLLEDTDSTGFTIFRKSDRSGVDISVSGGYYSTPGVCFGALDDMVSYQFSPM